MHALVAGGVDLDIVDSSGITSRQILAGWDALIDSCAVAARQRIAKTRLELVRSRALQVCLALQSRALDALQTCEILVHACGPAASAIPFHVWWKIATTSRDVQ